MADSEKDLTLFAEQKLASLEKINLRRRLRPARRGEAGAIEQAGDALISFSDNDYLGLSQHPAVKEAAACAAYDYGAGAGASRLVTGDCPLNGILEEKLAASKKTEAALVFGSGYLANISAVPALMGANDLVLLDELSHACMHAGARLSGATVQTFAHNDVEDAAAKLNNSPAKRKLVMTETVFSMDGDLAPLQALGKRCDEAGAWLMTDDAHGFGVVQQENPAPIQMGTLSKAVGAYGGYICGPRALIDLLINRGRGLIYTTGLPPAVLGAAIASLEIMEKEPARSEKALFNARRFCALAGLPAPHSTIVPVIIGGAEEALQASEALRRQGFLVTAIRPPTVPRGTARLRVSFSATHREEDVDRLARAVRALLLETGEALRCS